MSPFVTFRDNDSKGELQYYILQRDYPHFVGVVTYYPKGGAICEVPVSGHNLFVSFCGTIRGNYAPAYPKVEEEINQVFHAMAQWFYKNRIAVDPKRYKKWAIANTP
jgi:hypothetical protein